MKRYQLKSRRIASHSTLLRRGERKNRNKLIWTLILGGILIYGFFFWVVPNLIGSLSSINSFKPQPPSLTPISENVTLAPPVLSIPYEATNSFTIKIKGYSMPKTQVEIYLDDILQTTTQTEDDGSFTTENISLSLGTNNISSRTVDENGDRSLPSKVIHLIYDNEKPKLTISQPSDNQIISGDNKVTVAGKTDPTDISVLTINDTRAIVSSDGTFSLAVPLNEGDNNIVIAASDLAGNINSIARQVVFQP